jgi:pimeloyl-ACP methyl ester carboxylesterase
LRCFGKGIARRYPAIERVEVPYEGTTLPAWLYKADVTGVAPAVVMFDGLDNAKEMSVLFGGTEITRRGIHVLAIDGPGQGEALRLQGMPSRYDYEVPGRAALEPRFAACVAWGGHFNYHEAWVRRRKIMETGGTKVSAPSFQLPWVLGMPDMAACMKKLENYRLDGIAEKIHCPFYCIHGENDNIVPLEFAQRLYEAVGSKDKTLKILTAQDGGSDHCQEDNRQVGANLVADWLAERLGGRLV